MYPISDAAKALFESGEQRQVLRITFDTIKHYENVSLYDGDTLIYRNGNSQNLKLYSGQQQIYTVGNSQIIEIYSNDNLVYTNDPSGVPVHVVITDSDVMIDGFSIDRYSCIGTKLEIGNAIAAEMKCKLDNREGQYNSLKFEGVEMFVEVGIADWTQENPTITWIPCGYFTSDIQPRHFNTISLDMLDRMTKFDKVVDVSTFSMPDTVANIVSRCCTACGVTMVTLPTLPNTSEIIPALPVIQQDITYRNLIQWCAGIMGTNAWIDWEGKLRFSWYNNTTNYISTIANRFESDLYENAITITGVKYTDTDDNKTVYIAGTDVYALDLSGNMLITADNADDILVGVYDVVYGFSYTPFTASVINAPYLWPMDRISYNKHDIGHPTLLTNVNFGLNSATGLMGSGETKQTNGYAAPSGLTTSQTKALQQLRHSTTEAISDAVDNATAQITGADGGYVRFIYDANGKMTEIVIMNTNDITTATKVWRWNSGGLGYSSNGYAGPYTLAMTQDGAIVANFITTGTLDASLATITNLNASNITTGTLASARIAAGTITVPQLADTAKAALMSGTSSKLQYYLSTSSSSATGGSWSDTVPSWSSGKYVWTRVATTYTKVDGNSTTDYSTAVYDENLTTALSTSNSALGSTSVKSQYYLSTSSSSATGGTWSDTVPAWSSGKYVWTRVATTTTTKGNSTNTTYSTAIYDENLTTALSTAASAYSTASAAQTAANSANSSTQLIYKSATSGTTSMAAPTAWISDTTGSQATWTLKRPVYSASYPVLFVATQSNTVGGIYSCTTPMVDQTTTVIDGGHITTGTIDAGVVNVTHIDASNISAGTMSANHISGGTIDGNTVNAKQLQIVDGNGNVIASFNNIITLGETSDVHAEFDFNSLEIKDADGDVFVLMGDIRNADGYFERTDSYTVQHVIGGVAEFTLSYNTSTKDNILSVTVNGNSISPDAYTVTHDSIEGYRRTLLNISAVSASIQVGDSVAINYKADEPIYRYDFGMRDTTKRVGMGSVSEGYQTAAYGAYSHAEGIKSIAGTGCHAEGNGTEASGYCGHAEGAGTTANGYYSHAEGGRTTASDYYSHAEGFETTASGYCSHAEGRGTIAYGPYQHVSGKYNIQRDGNYLEVIGNGDANSRSDARYLTISGTEWIAGSYTNASDKRLKTECGEVPDVSDIKARRFKWNDKKLNHDDKEHLGYFAQDVEEVAPYLVDEDAMGYKSLDYNGILVAKIASLERRVAELENMMKGSGQNV